MLHNYADMDRCLSQQIFIVITILQFVMSKMFKRLHEMEATNLNGFVVKWKLPPLLVNNQGDLCHCVRKSSSCILFEKPYVMVCLRNCYTNLNLCLVYGHFRPKVNQCVLQLDVITT